MYGCGGTALLIELTFWSRLLLTDEAGPYVGHVIVLALDWSTGDAAQHRQLPDVGERVRYRSGKKPGPWTRKRLGPGKEFIERTQRAEKALHILVPLARGRVVPGLLSFRQRERPVEQVTNVGDDFRRGAAVVA